MKTKITIYTDIKGQVYLSQNEDNTLTIHKVAELPTIPEVPLKDGCHIYKKGKLTFGYEINVNKCYGAINDLKAQLKATDYMIAKLAEGEKCDKCDATILERQAHRAKINEIEQLLSAI